MPTTRKVPSPVGGFKGGIFAALLLALLSFPTTAQDFPPPLMGPWVAYTDAAADAVHIYDLSTDLTRRLSVGTGYHTVWDTSPDGCRVLFTYAEPGQPASVMSMRLDGTDARDLVDTSALPESAWDAWEPDWSPDGNLVALTLSRPDPTEDRRESRVGWIPAAGGAPTFYSVAGDEHTPRWSPDGNWLAYISYALRPAGATINATAVPELADNAPLLREADLWTVSADGLTKARITRLDVGSATNPRWSPDGSLLAFTYSPQPGDNQLWMIASVPDAIPTQLSFTWHQALDLLWEPSGERLLLAARDFGGEPAARLWSVPLIGNADTAAVLALAGTPLASAPVDYPRYSADGAWLAVRSDYDLVLFATASGEVRRLGSVGNTPPVWSPVDFVGEATCNGA